MKVKLIIISLLFSIFVLFTGGCLQFMEGLGGITSPSLEVDRGDGTVNYWAVIVGIEDYQSMTDLSYTIDDAEDMRDVLLSYGNWDNSNIQFLTDVDASKSGIKSAISIMATLEDADDVCLFFFSGHGSNIPDVDGDEEGIEDYHDEVICPWDTTEELRNVISDDELGTWLSACSGNVVVILDTCTSGGFTKGIEETVKAIFNPRVSKDSIAKHHFVEGLVEYLKQSTISRDLNKTGYVVLMACEEDKSAYESRRLTNGVFTYYIVEGLWGPADADNDNNISAEEDFDYAAPLVRQYKPTNQDPQLWDGYAGGDLQLVIASPPDAGTIAGNVTEAETDSAIVGATVVVEGPNLSATTDANGNYTITDVAEGTYTVTASATGYSEESKTADVLQGETTVVDFTLTPTTTSSNTMHVSIIEMLLQEATAGPNIFYTAVAKVTIVGASDNPIEGATVSGHWSGVTTDVDSGVTDANGQVSLESDKVKNPTSGTIFTFTVDDVIKAGWTYDSEGSVTSESITAP